MRIPFVFVRPSRYCGALVEMFPRIFIICEGSMFLCFPGGLEVSLFKNYCFIGVFFFSYFHVCRGKISKAGGYFTIIGMHVDVDVMFSR